MDIKEIALKHAREYMTFKLGDRKGLDVEEIVCDDEIYKEIVNELAQQFEAFIAEIAKQNEPVAWMYPNETALSEHETDGPVVKARIPLYTIPPTAEQIANETAEAIAEYMQQSGIGGEFLAESIRSGEWRKFVKEV